MWTEGQTDCHGRYSAMETYLNVDTSRDDLQLSTKFLNSTAYLAALTDYYCLRCLYFTKQLSVNLPCQHLATPCSGIRSGGPELPNDPRTLLQTPRTCVSKSLKRGKYVHLGLERGLLDELRLCPLTGIPEVRVQLHIDGMKVFKASAQCLWPILARVNHPVVGQPFVVGVFCGFGKPEPLEDFLGDCVSELKCLLTTGLRDPRTESVIKVNLLNVICDTPARCYVRQVKPHNGYYGCDRHIRKLSSDSDDEDSPHQPTEPTGWPAPPPILQHSTTISSYVSTATISTEFSQQVQKDMADIKGQLVNTNVRLAALEKRNDFLAEQLMALNSSVQQMQATLSDVVNALQRASSAGSVTSSSLNLPLCTEEAYENFLRRLSVEDGFANVAVCAHLFDCFQIRQLAMVGGRNEADFLRNLLTVLLGPPLCHNFCWAGGSKEKKSFMACPLFSVLKDYRNHHTCRHMPTIIPRQRTGTANGQWKRLLILDTKGAETSMIQNTLLAILIIAEVAICVVTLTKKTELGAAVESMVNRSFFEQFNDQTVRSAFRWMEDELDCCGVNGYSDYWNLHQPSTCELDTYTIVIPKAVSSN
ncbi:hypothetical protein SprV_0200654200 [Sparganum proliferum]